MHVSSTGTCTFEYKDMYRRRAPTGTCLGLVCWSHQFGCRTSRALEGLGTTLPCAHSSPSSRAFIGCPVDQLVWAWTGDATEIYGVQLQRTAILWEQQESTMMDAR